jgi:2-iminobutanoate/2-iminopropanoate deaminase
MKQPVKTDQAPAPIGPYNQAIKAGQTYYVSGQIALDVATGDLLTESLEVETRQVMLHIGAILASEGLTHDHIVKSSIFIKNMDDFSKINEVYGSFFTDTYPARETVEVARLPKDANVEISVIAVKG